MQLQLIVPPETATYELISSGSHFGEIACPFCHKKIVVLGPIQGKGFAWLHSTCSHSAGITAGNGNDITVLFNGIRNSWLVALLDDFEILLDGDVVDEASSQQEADETILKHVVDDDVIIRGYGAHSGRRFWQIPEAIRVEVLKIASS